MIFAKGNPLLELLARNELPPFRRIEPAHAEPALDQLLAANRKAIAELVARENHWNWQNLVMPLEELDDRLHRAWAPAAHLNHVMNSEAWRAAYNACLPKLSEYNTEVGQNEALYRAWQALAEDREFGRLDNAQQKLVRDTLRDFRLSGVALAADAKARFREIAQQLAKLQAKFEENLLDATQAWTKTVTAQQLAGLPESSRAQAREQARRRDLDGWLLTLDFPSYHAVITYADDRALREEIYTAFSTRASDQGPHAGRWDNSALMNDILRLRHEASRLLGFASFAERSLATKMAETPARVLGFLRDLAVRSRPRAERDLAELRAFARQSLGIAELQAWDLAYASEKLRQARYRISDEALRPWFPLSQVLQGLFGIVGRLYGIRIEALTGIETWHPDVSVYEIREPDGAVRGRFFLDPYARPDKRGGAWMDDCAGRRQGRQGLQVPVAFLTCNFTPPLPGQPALLTHDEVLTLFHEFGHGLHHMLTRVEAAGVAGINGVPWDAVELPSQFMENWCWERAALDLFARHWQTGEPLPEELYTRMRASRNFQSALMMLRQIEFALFDFRLHLEYEPARGARILELLDEVRAEVSVFRPPAFNRFAHSFSHVFAGGYAAGYYSYKWAEVLSADAYAAFEEAGIFDTTTGRRFLTTILEQGGSREAMDLFVAFRGRPPAIEPLLRHNGLLEEAA